MSDKVASLRVERLALAALKPHPRNPRKHPAPDSPAWDALKISLAHDYFDPLVVNERNGMLVSGHLRHKVLLASDFTHADVSVVDYDEETHFARLIAANNLLGEWEESILAALARDLETAGLSAGLAGWNEKQLAAQLDGPRVDDDTAAAADLVSQAEEIQRTWAVKLGDIYAAGAHRILCGDCTDAGNWRALLGDQLADLIWTDPPYNVDYDSTQRHRAAWKLKAGQRVNMKPEALLNDHLTDDAYSQLLQKAFATAHAFTRAGGSIYVAHAESYGLENRVAMAAAGWYVAQCLVWVKNSFALSRQDYQWQHEPILYGWKQGAGHYWQGGFSQSTVIDDERIDFAKATKAELIAAIQQLRNARDTSVIRESRSAKNELHPTIKPLPLVARHLWNSSRRGDTVCDLFPGSGTTVIAAEQTARRCVATELDPKFCAVILERLKRHGLTVEKVRDGAA